MRFFIGLLICLYLCSCQQEIDSSILNNQTEFTLLGSPNNCSQVVPTGIYKKGKTLDAANKITVDVNVTKTGTWSGHTNLINGISFSGSGTFSAEGPQTITLQGTGTPILAGQNSFIISTGGNGCTFILTVDTSSAPSTNNVPPTANAGVDKTTTLPANSIVLSGSGLDVDGSISAYLWSKVSGPNTFTIVNPTQAQTTINNLVQGNYQFELRVTDNLGATGRDTVTVSVLDAPVPGRLTMQQELFFTVNPISDGMYYDGNNKIITISSNQYPEMRISYSNNKISSIEYWYTNGSGTGMSKDETNTLVYDINGNVVKINQTDNITGQTFVLADLTYNSDNTLKRKKVFNFDGSILNDNAYAYTNGNLTKLIANPDFPSPDTTIITYDTRVNNFKNIYPQYYFLDIQTTFAQTNRSEIFYFSNNYPTNIGGSLPVSVSINNTNQKPFEVRFDNVLWYRYVYN